MQQLAAQIPWFHNCVLLDKVKRPEERVWYIHQNISHGWSRNVLVNQIESSLYERQGRARVNFERTLPAPQSELARQIIKDPYNFDFLTLGKEAQERDLEAALLSHLREFLLEHEVGFVLCKEKNRVIVEYALREINTIPAPSGFIRVAMLTLVQEIVAINIRTDIFSTNKNTK